jgi:hypothetical protein
MAVFEPSFGGRRAVTPLDFIHPKVLAQRFEPSFGEKYRIEEFPLQLVRDGRLQFTQKQGTYQFSFLPIEICTFGQTMVQTQEVMTGIGFKGLTSNCSLKDNFANWEA